MMNLKRDLHKILRNQVIVEMITVALTFITEIYNLMRR